MLSNVHADMEETITKFYVNSGRNTCSDEIERIL